MKTWQLRKGAERKVRGGHPWIFSNDLAHSPKGTEPGEIIELHDAQNQFLARGYGHPNSLIAFRKLTADPAETDVLSVRFVADRIAKAAEMRQQLGYGESSYRLCFAEADGMPGLIVDRFRGPDEQTLVVQTSTAGMDRALDAIVEGLKMWAHNQGDGDRTRIIISNNSKSRVLENLAVEPRRVAWGSDDATLRRTPIRVRAFDGSFLPFHVDLIEGQKTGFFLDQHYNVTTTCRMVSECLATWDQLHVLDLCCYVGQWSTHLAQTAQQKNKKAICTLVDASASALDLASQNVQAQGADVMCEKLDVLAELNRLPERFYQVVVCDPPAFIKRKKDLAQGKTAYVKMNRDALKRVAPGGLFISCSCSGLLSGEEFEHALQTAVVKSGRNVQWLVRGSQSPDHPVRMEFPEGKYLKCFIGRVSN